jgi:hypothetical protein
MKKIIAIINQKGGVGKTRPFQTWGYQEVFYPIQNWMCDGYEYTICCQDW